MVFSVHFDAGLKTPVAGILSRVRLLPEHPMVSPDTPSCIHLEYAVMFRILEIIGGFAVCYLALSIAVYWRAQG